MKTQRVAYFDCYSGISGDMILGALFDLGVDSSKVRKALRTLDLKGYKLKSIRVKRGLIAGTKAQVSLEKTKHFHVSARKYSDIKKMIANGFNAEGPFVFLTASFPVSVKINRSKNEWTVQTLAAEVFLLLYFDPLF